MEVLNHLTAAGCFICLSTQDVAVHDRFILRPRALGLALLLLETLLIGLARRRVPRSHYWLARVDQGSQRQQSPTKTSSTWSCRQLGPKVPPRWLFVVGVRSADHRNGAAS